MHFSHLLAYLSLIIACEVVRAVMIVSSISDLVSKFQNIEETCPSLHRNRTPQPLVQSFNKDQMEEGAYAVDLVDT